MDGQTIYKNLINYGRILDRIYFYLNKTKEELLNTDIRDVERISTLCEKRDMLEDILREVRKNVGE